MSDVIDERWGDPAGELLDLIGKRKELSGDLEHMRRQMRSKIDILRAQGWSYRRIGQTVGLSGQRIEQMHKGR